MIVRIARRERRIRRHRVGNRTDARPWPRWSVSDDGRLDLRQEDLADLAGVSLRFVQALEAGKAMVQLDRVEAVLVVLGLCLTVEPVPR